VFFQDDLPGDILSAFTALEKFSKSVEIIGEKAVIAGAAVKPEAEVYCGNSGTVMHILMGICCFMDWDVKFLGDRSLMSRDHSAFFRAAKLYESGGIVKTELEKESAQLKSFHLLAMLKNGGELSYKWETRNNTEVLLKKMGADISDNGSVISVKAAKAFGGYSEMAQKDPSSAFIAVCAGLILGKEIKIENILGEELRLEAFSVLKKAGYQVKIVKSGQKVTVETGKKAIVGEPVDIKGDKVAKVIDEIPFLAYMTARNGLNFSCENAHWLRNKESDRITETARLLSGFFKVIEKTDGFTVFSQRIESEKKLFHSDDHRMEMLATLISLDQNISFKPNVCYNISFPGFEKVLEFLKSEEK
jgi:5-enolpyruvylshikimate-3-phosphate synthase